MTLFEFRTASSTATLIYAEFIRGFLHLHFHVDPPTKLWDGFFEIFVHDLNQRKWEFKMGSSGGDYLTHVVEFVFLPHPESDLTSRVIVSDNFSNAFEFSLIA